MKDIISRAMSSGLDFTRRGAAKSFLSRLDIDQDLYDKLYVNIKNRAFENDFAETPYDRRYLFLPQCLRDSVDCEADLTDEGYECEGCGSCCIDEIISYAEELGYGRTYIVPGGSMVRKILQRKKPEAAVGVACYLELAESIEHIGLYDIIPQGVPLLQDGCKDTKVDIERLKEVLEKRKR